MHKLLFGHMSLIFLGRFLGVDLLDCTVSLCLSFFFNFFKFYFIFKLYIIVLVLPNIKMFIF